MVNSPVQPGTERPEHAGENSKRSFLQERQKRKLMEKEGTDPSSQLEREK